MGIFKANFQSFDHCLKTHGESLVPTVFRRLLWPIRVGFFPLEKTPGGFRFQVSFKIRFPKPPWNLFSIKTLIFIAFSCLNQVTKMSGNLWHHLQHIILGVIFVSFVSRELVGQFWDYSLIGQNNSLTYGDPNSDRRRHMGLFNLYLLFFLIVCTSYFVIATTVLDLLVSGNIFWYRQRYLWRRISQFVQSVWKTNRTQMRVLDNTDIEEFVEMGAITDYIVILGFTWRIISWHFGMFGIFSRGFQTKSNKKSWDLFMVRQVLPGLSESFIRGDLSQSTGFKVLQICLLKGQMRFWESSIFTQRETMVINEQRCIRRFKKHDPDSFQATYQSIHSIKVMRKAFRSFIYKMIACYECMKRGLNRFILLPVRLLLESRVTSTSSSKLGFNFLYLLQWLYLNGFMYHVKLL